MTTPLDRVGIRRLCMYLEKEIRRGTHSLPPEDFREQFVSLARGIMDGVIERGARIKEYTVTIESTGRYRYLGKLGLKPFDNFIYLEFDIQRWNRYRSIDDPFNNVEYYYEE